MTTTPPVGTLGPDAAATRLSRIAEVSRHDLAKATKLAAKAKADGVRSPLVHHLVALELKDASRFDEAIVELGLGLELAPQDPRLLTTVGFCLLELNRRQEAAQVFERAMKLDPGSAEAAYGYGWTAERLGALPSAESAFNRAVKLDPNHADGLAGLAGLAVRRREWAVARDLANRAIAVSTRQTDALMNLARIDIGEENFELAERRLRDIVTLPNLPPLARANAWIMLGDALDGQGRFEAAYDAYAKGKSELRDLYASEFGGSERPTSQEVVSAMLKEFTATPAAAWTSPPSGANRSADSVHAFLVGFPRTGTTLLEQVIATHPEMAALGERPTMIDAESEFLSRAGGLARLSSVMPDLLEPFRQAYWRRVRGFGVDPAGKVFVDKHPLSTIRLPLIYKMFPDAKVIFAIRDPLDVVLSCFRRSFNMNANMYEFNSLVTTARFYNAVMTAGETYLERLPFAVHRVRHEEMVEDFDTASIDLCAFLGVDWTPKLKDFANTARSIATPSGAQVAKGLSAEGVGHWRNYAFALEPVAGILAPWVEKFGYSSA